MHNFQLSSLVTQYRTRADAIMDPEPDNSEVIQKIKSFFPDFIGGYVNGLCTRLGHPIGKMARRELTDFVLGTFRSDTKIFLGPPLVYPSIDLDEAIIEKSLTLSGDPAREDWLASAPQLRAALDDGPADAYYRTIQKRTLREIAELPTHQLLTLGQSSSILVGNPGELPKGFWQRVCSDYKEAGGNPANLEHRSGGGTLSRVSVARVLAAAENEISRTSAKSRSYGTWRDWERAYREAA